MWEGRYVAAPDPHSRHGAVQIELGALLAADVVAAVDRPPLDD